MTLRLRPYPFAMVILLLWGGAVWAQQDQSGQPAWVTHGIEDAEIFYFVGKGRATVPGIAGNVARLHAEEQAREFLRELITRPTSDPSFKLDPEVARRAIVDTVNVLKVRDMVTAFESQPPSAWVTFALSWVHKDSVWFHLRTHLRNLGQVPPEELRLRLFAAGQPPVPH